MDERGRAERGWVNVGLRVSGGGRERGGKGERKREGERVRGGGGRGEERCV